MILLLLGGAVDPRGAQLVSVATTCCCSPWNLRKGLDMFPALTQFFNDFTIFGGDLLSIALEATFGA